VELLDFPVKLRNSLAKVYIHCFSDIHRSASGCDHAKLRSDINKLKHLNETTTDLHYWFGGGDWCNAIGPKDKRHDAAAIAPGFRDYIGDDLFGYEASVLSSEFRCIREWGIGVGMGNHEASVAKYNEFNPAKRIAESLDLPYLGYSALVRFRMYLPRRGASTALMYWHHGAGAARSAGGKLNMLMRMRDVVLADVYVVGHVHEIIDVPKIRMTATRKGKLMLEARPVLFVNSGTYQKGYATDTEPQEAGKYNHRDPGDEVRPDYAEKAAYEPSVIGHNGFSMRMVHKTKEGGKTLDLRRVDWR